MSHVLVCGGAGYVGSHMVRLLLTEGHQVSVFDNLSTGHREAVQGAALVEGDLLDPGSLHDAFARQRVDAVMHFAALSIVNDSIRDPFRYYQNNVTGTLNLLQAMRAANVDRLVFSSSAAVYGVADVAIIDEKQPLASINPYGASKAMAERLLADAATAHGLRATALRYFNASGADASGEIGEAHDPETHLIPNVLRAASDGASVSIFGADHPTSDGTCIRDYVHVSDLADAHLRAMTHMERNAGFHVFNLGCGEGFSVRQVIEVARSVTGRAVDYQVVLPRPGDPARLVASSQRAREVLGWQPASSDLHSIIESAWQWHQFRRY